MTAAALGVLQEQLRALQDAFPGATATGLPDGTTLVTVPGLSLPAGWNCEATQVHFQVPVGYPAAQPDCFWADAELRLAGGQLPANSNLTPVAGVGPVGLWFSWHVQTWNPIRATLLSYVRVIQDRFLRGN